MLLVASLLFVSSPLAARAGEFRPISNSAQATETPQVRRVEGVVLDQVGRPLQGASVVLRNGASVVGTASTDENGRFVFQGVPFESGSLVVRARGFAIFERQLKAGDGEFRITLSPAPISEQVTVTATRTEARLSETAASLVVISAAEVESTAALTLDDVLRQVPGFQLFRRSGSRTANPTSQGVTLRGVGPSGASRALVLFDGVPLNDPFGGWVYWGRVPRSAVGRVEVLRGGASHLYGSSALGGVVQVVGREADDATLSLEASYGNQATADASLLASWAQRGWGASLAAELFRTDGYVIVDEQARGRVDEPAGTRHSSAVLTLERRFDQSARAYLRGSHFDESRQNGTPLQRNGTRVRQLVAGADFQPAAVGTFSLRAYVSSQVFDQTFTAVAAGRQSESLTRLQRVPAQSAGLSVQWSRAVGARHALLAGLDAREVRGASDELGYFAGRPTSRVDAGGRERGLGLFVQDSIRVSERLIVTPSLRLDRWRNFDARQTARTLSTGATSLLPFAEREETAFSPQLSALLRLRENLSLSAAFYRAFRAPTLNELYRGFRVGDAVTLANENLRAERLTGGEAGAFYSSPGARLTARATLFWSEVVRPVANVTLSVTPTLITRQRQNLGRTRSRGVELETQVRLGNHWHLSGGYVLTGARVLEFPADRGLEGLFVPQVARQQFNFQARYANPRTLTFALQGRAAGRQYDDDRNLFPLGSYFTLDALASRTLSRGLEAFVAAENLLGSRYEVGRTPVLTLGPPLLVRAGLRLRIGPR